VKKGCSDHGPFLLVEYRSPTAFVVASGPSILLNSLPHALEHVALASNLAGGVHYSLPLKASDQVVALHRVDDRRA
jgi:hypothetical protein